MDGLNEEQKVTPVNKNENIEESIDLSEIENAENFLESVSDENLKFLEFERQMFLDCIYNDGLVICSK